SREPSSTTITSTLTPDCARALSIASARNGSPSLTGMTTLTSGSNDMRRIARGAAARNRRPQHAEVYGRRDRGHDSRVLAVNAIADERLVHDRAPHVRITDTEDPVEVLAHG